MLVRAQEFSEKKSDPRVFRDGVGARFDEPETGPHRNSARVRGRIYHRHLRVLNGPPRALQVGPMLEVLLVHGESKWLGEVVRRHSNFHRPGAGALEAVEPEPKGVIILPVFLALDDMNLFSFQ